MPQLVFAMVFSGTIMQLRATAAGIIMVWESGVSCTQAKLYR